jgi:membrane-associated phospholipid phosphatase
MEIYSLAIILIYSALCVFFFVSIEFSDILLVSNTLIFVFILFAARFSENFPERGDITLFRRLYIIPVIFYVYSQVQVYIPHVNPGLYDEILAEWDWFIFGVDPTHWLAQYSHPVLTEFLQFTYMLYFVFPLVLGIELHRRDDKSFLDFSSVVVFTYYSSYLLYFIMPAIGPRFLLHEFHSINENLPGLLLADFFRGIINTGGSIPPGVMNPEDFVNRDCMPSGHTMITLVSMVMAFKHSSGFRYLILILGSCLIFSTVYLWYHYVVDIFAGIILAFLILIIEPLLRKPSNRFNP